MIDSSLQKLCQYRQQQSGDQTFLWALGEVDSNLLAQIPASDTIISNRLSSDEAINARLTLRDFTFPTDLPSATTVLMRLAKEKLLNQHIILQASQQASAIMLIGQKSEGIKSYQRFAQNYFADVSLQKDNQDYWLHCQDPIPNNEPSEYEQWLQISHPLLDQPYWSKAGIFSRDHIDPGTAVLINVLSEQAVDFSGKTVIDLGCGSGLLSLIANQFGAADILAVDNNATAIVASERNFADFNARAKTFISHIDQFIPADWRYDIALCNPPFHQGFNHKKSLTQDFVDAISRRVKPGGEAWIVVNQFIGTETAISKADLTIIRIIEREHFTILQLATAR